MVAQKGLTKSQKRGIFQRSLNGINTFVVPETKRESMSIMFGL
jgi:hypothetical protein